MKPLSQEEKLDLREMLHHAGFKALMKMVEGLADLRASDVIKYDLSSGDERELIRRKCRAEGAAQLLASMKRELETLKGEPGKPAR